MLAGRDVLVQSPTGSGKTLAFGIPLVDRIAADGPPPGGARARADARARHPDRRRAPRRSPRPARCASPPSTAASACSSRPRTPPASHILVATPGRLEDLLAAAPSRSTRPHARARRGRPDARHGLPPGASTASSRSARPTARRCSSRPRSTARPARLARRYTERRRLPRARPDRAPRQRRRRAPLRRGRSMSDRLDALVEHLDGERDLTLVFVRTKHGADRLVKQLSSARRRRGRDARQQVPAPARAGARAASSPARSTRSSPPTSPPAASTSSGISHVINFTGPSSVHQAGGQPAASRQQTPATVWPRRDPLLEHGRRWVRWYVFKAMSENQPQRSGPADEHDIRAPRHEKSGRTSVSATASSSAAWALIGGVAAGFKAMRRGEVVPVHAAARGQPPPRDRPDDRERRPGRGRRDR